MKSKEKINEKWAIYLPIKEDLDKKVYRIEQDDEFPEFARELLTTLDGTRNFLKFCSNLIYDNQLKPVKLFFREIVETALLGAESNILFAFKVIKMLDYRWLKEHLYNTNS